MGWSQEQRLPDWGTAQSAHTVVCFPAEPTLLLAFSEFGLDFAVAKKTLSPM
jgi:hypothetical protein